MINEEIHLKSLQIFYNALYCEKLGYLQCSKNLCFFIQLRKFFIQNFSWQTLLPIKSPFLSIFSIDFLLFKVNLTFVEGEIFKGRKVVERINFVIFLIYVLIFLQNLNFLTFSLAFFCQKRGIKNIFPSSFLRRIKREIKFSCFLFFQEKRKEEKRNF